MTIFWYIIYIIIAIILLIIISYYLNNIGIGIFQRIIIVISILILELMFGIIIYYNGGITTNIIYPPTSNICPDYWQYQNNLCLIPTNKRNIGSFSIIDKTPPHGYDTNKNGIDFNNSGWSSLSTTKFCEKQKWSNINNILWDGITNIDGVC